MPPRHDFHSLTALDRNERSLCLTCCHDSVDDMQLRMSTPDLRCRPPFVSDFGLKYVFA